MMAPSCLHVTVLIFPCGEQFLLLLFSVSRCNAISSRQLQSHENQFNIRGKNYPNWPTLIFKIYLQQIERVTSQDNCLLHFLRLILRN